MAKKKKYSLKLVKAETQGFSQPIQQVVLMLISLLLAMVGSYFMFPSVAPIFLSSPYLNGVILTVFFFGILCCFWQIFVIIAAVNWVENFALDTPGHEFSDPPRLLIPLASLLKGKKSKTILTSSSLNSILDSVATRLNEARDLTRYVINLLIFLGLLGTFYGLAITVPEVVNTIKSLVPKEGQTGIEVFDNLMAGLEGQLGGMGTAFASSLLGLAGSLVVGLLELFANHGQNRFYMQLEEWLSSFTSIGIFGDTEDVNDTTNDGKLSPIISAVGAQISELGQMFEKSIDNSAKTNQQINSLSKAIEEVAGSKVIGSKTVTSTDGFDKTSIEKLVSSQQDLNTLIKGQFGERSTRDLENLTRLRNIEVQLSRLVDELANARHDALSELRSDLAQLSKAIIDLARNSSKG
ncbi:biopolymer transporter ExbB [Paracoccaceae bacterium]|nr:biopolymer transporter ExbB [Paracoccaceae bacterium]